MATNVPWPCKCGCEAWQPLAAAPGRPTPLQVWVDYIQQPEPDLHAYWDQVKAEAHDLRARNVAALEGPEPMGPDFIGAANLDRAMSIPGPAERSFGAMLTPHRRHGQS